MIPGLIEGKSPKELVWFARGPLKSKVQELFDSLNEPLGERHRLLLSTIHHHMGFLSEELRHIDEYVFEAMAPYQPQWDMYKQGPESRGMSGRIHWNTQRSPAPDGNRGGHGAFWQ
ncbi:MAG: hypothetical protein CSA33_07890 [Desulfobulbus propionicus]|nr:MAG: hypothetical protein CSA33_07890 [Desulfobulbus propionicus]